MVSFLKQVDVSLKNYVVYCEELDQKKSKSIELAGPIWVGKMDSCLLIIDTTTQSNKVFEFQQDWHIVV